MDLDKIISAWEHCTSDEGDCDDCPYNEVSVSVQECRGVLSSDALELLKEQEAVEPIKTCASANPLGVDGLLIVGNCPVCGQYSINNRDNKFCGGCGIPIN